jgi:hypothetical protein
MQTLRSTNTVSTSEWRWVIIVSGILIALTLAPYAWALARDDNNGSWQFMGVLANPQDGATYLSKIEQGRQGAWLFELRHTPERHDGAGFHTFYLLLGHMAKLTGLSNLLIFHLARVATSFLMYISLYQLGAAVWVRLRPRRLFFTLIGVGSGLGWLLPLFKENAAATDLLIPESIPFYSAYANPHFPLSIACLALIAASFIIAFRRGFNEQPDVENGGLLIMLLSMLLALIQPTALIPIGGALVAYVGTRYYLTRKFPVHELRWGSMLWLPALPFVVYYFSVFRFNDVMGEFNKQNITPSPAPYLYVFGYGLLLIVALPGLGRAFRHFERDGDQFMLLWFIVNVIGLYAPFNLQRRLAMGLIIPIVYFAVRALEDYWFYKIAREWRAPTMIALIVFMIPSNVFVLLISLFGVLNPDAGLKNGYLIQSDYWHAYQWLKDNGEKDAVVMAAPNISLWLPAYTDQVVVYGHPFETVHAKERQNQVLDWYHGVDCTAVLDEDLPFHVSYILWGPQEQDLGEDEDKYPDTGTCIGELPIDTQQVQIGDVTIYILD